MDLPFPSLLPRLVDPKWFSADSPCDEEAELTSLEQAYQASLTAIGDKFTKHPPLGKTNQELMEEEADSDDEGNDESDETEESHDEDEELRTTYTSPQNNVEAEPQSYEDLQIQADFDSLDQSQYSLM